MAFPFAVVGSALETAGGFVNSLIGANRSKKNTQATIRAQKDLAEYSYTKDLEMWNRANEYNTPSAQMGRISEAGLNPNLVYGSGSVAGNTATQTPKYQAYNPQYRQTPVQLPSFGNVLQNFMDLKVKQAQIDNIGANTQQKSIENQYLGKKLGFSNWKSFLDIGSKANMFGQAGQIKKDPTIFDSEAFKGSPYLQQFQATTSQKIQDAQLKMLEGNLRKQGITGSDNMLLRMAVQSGLFNLETLKNMFK